jgi:tRNA(fMet)-specific endonuclease VapC
VILDTNALSAFADGTPAVGARLSAAARLALPVIVLGQFRYGISRSRHRRQYEDWLARLLRDIEVLAITETTTVHYARIRVSLKKLGRPIRANDAWIAALALEHGLPVLSQDQHFDAVPALRRETW